MTLKTINEHFETFKDCYPEMRAPGAERGAHEAKKVFFAGAFTMLTILKGQDYANMSAHERMVYIEKLRAELSELAEQSQREHAEQN